MAGGVCLFPVDPIESQRGESPWERRSATVGQGTDEGGMRREAGVFFRCGAKSSPWEQETRKHLKRKEVDTRAGEKTLAHKHIPGRRRVPRSLESLPIKLHMKWKAEVVMRFIVRLKNEKVNPFGIC